MPRVDRREAIAVSAILLCGVLLRLPGLLNTLWLDEVWSLRNAVDAPSWTTIFGGLRTDNNHHLNSLWMRWAGESANAAVHRAPAFVAGIGTVLFAWLVGREENRTAGIATAAFFAVSFPFVYYSSEARGYSIVVFFTMAALYCLLKLAARPSPAFLAGFWISSILAVLAHQTYVVFFIAALLWFNARAERSTGSVRAASRLVASTFVPAGIGIAVIYLSIVRGTGVEGGPRSPVSTIAAQMLSLVWNGPAQSSWTFAAGAGAAVVALAAIVWAFSRRDDRWLLFAAGGVFVPALFVAANPAIATYARYFIVPAAILVIACGSLAAACWNRGGPIRMVTIATAIAVTVGCLLHVANLAKNGRGRFDEAVRMMAGSTASAATVASAPEFTAHDRRVRMLLSYYAGITGRGASLRYVEESAYPPAGTTWMIREGLDQTAETPTWTDKHGNVFSLVQAYDASPLAGIAWNVYRRDRSE